MWLVDVNNPTNIYACSHLQHYTNITWNVNTIRSGISINLSDVNDSIMDPNPMDTQISDQNVNVHRTFKTISSFMISYDQSNEARSLKDCSNSH